MPILDAVQDLLAYDLTEHVGKINGEKRLKATLAEERVRRTNDADI